MAPVDKSPANSMAGFELVHSLQCNDSIPVYKYRSENTGLNVFIAEVDGPQVHGYFCLATEAHDDDGLPHTLEHLIFLGSEECPYKGVLDLLGNRCLASGTNAWTDRDHTAYTLTTVGSEGFLSLLPIYLDHVLYPTLTDSGFFTEIHHVTAKGEDAGVAYCEIQYQESDSYTLVYNELMRAIYPGKCGYKSITGGTLKSFRESTTNEKIKDYHKQYYRPENLTVIITGHVNHTDVFKTLKPLEEKIISKGCRGPFTRPWQNPVPPLTESVHSDVYYPCDDEDNGLVHVGWRGPSSVTEIYEMTACALLLKYLTDNPVSPVQREFVEVADPYASNVSYWLSENTISALCLMFKGVPVSKIPLIKDHLVKTLKNIADNGIDIKRMKNVVNRHMLEMLGHLESMPHDTVAFMLIGDVLFGNTKEDLDQRLNQVRDFKKLMEEPESYWLNILKRYLINSPMVVVNGIPSCAKQKELAELEKNRVAKQIEDLGQEGLERKERELQQAIALNEAPIPDKILTSIPIPGIDNINFHRIKSYTTETSEQHPRFDVRKLPLYAYVDHANTNFIYMFVIMDTSAIARELRPYLPILLEAIRESPVERNGKLVPYEDVVTELEEDTIHLSTSIGLIKIKRFFCGSYSNSVNMMIQLDLTKYAKGVQWIQELLYDTKFTVDRLKVIGAKMINDVAEYKTKGTRAIDYLMKGLLYNEDSNHFATSLLRQQKFLTNMMERLNTESGQKEVLLELEGVRKILTAKKSTVLYMAANIDKLVAHVPDVYAPWKALRTEENEEKNRLHVIPDWKLLNSRENVPMQGCVVGLGCLDSAFFSQCTRCISDYEHPDLAPLHVCLQYFTQLEGPMWKQIRGQGLSYDFDIYTKLNSNLLYLTFDRATNVVDVYKEAKSIIETHINENKWDRLLYESAKSSLIFKILSKEKNTSDMLAQSLLSYFKNVPHDYNHQRVQRVYAVKFEDLGRVAAKYLKSLFDPKQCQTVIVCHPLKAHQVAADFKQFDYDLKVYTSFEKSYLNYSKKQQLPNI